jgi:hypothetical protein
MDKWIARLLVFLVVVVLLVAARSGCWKFIHAMVRILRCGWPKERWLSSTHVFMFPPPTRPLRTEPSLSATERSQHWGPRWRSLPAPRSFLATTASSRRDFGTPTCTSPNPSGAWRSGSPRPRSIRNARQSAHREPLLNQPYKRGCQEKILLPPLWRRGQCCVLHPARSRLWRGCALAA